MKHGLSLDINFTDLSLEDVVEIIRQMKNTKFYTFSASLPKEIPSTFQISTWSQKDTDPQPISPSDSIDPITSAHE